MMNQPCRIVRGALLIAASLVLTACGAGKTLVVEPVEVQASVKSVHLVRESSPVSVPDEVERRFQEKLAEFVYAQGGFVRGDELAVHYRFVQYDPGSQFTRWFWGGIGNAGQGSLTIEARFVDATGRPLSRIQSEGEINSGFFGGDFGLAVDKAAAEIAEYAVTHFRDPAVAPPARR